MCFHPKYFGRSLSNELYLILMAFVFLFFPWLYHKNHYFHSLDRNRSYTVFFRPRFFFIFFFFFFFNSFWCSQSRWFGSHRCHRWNLYRTLPDNLFDVTLEKNPWDYSTNEKAWSFIGSCSYNLDLGSCTTT